MLVLKCEYRLVFKICFKTEFKLCLKQIVVLTLVLIQMVLPFGFIETRRNVAFKLKLSCTIHF